MKLPTDDSIESDLTLVSPAPPGAEAGSPAAAAPAAKNTDVRATMLGRPAPASPTTPAPVAPPVPTGPGTLTPAPTRPALALPRPATSAAPTATTPPPIATGGARPPLFASRPAASALGEPMPAPRVIGAPKGVEPAAMPSRTLLFGKSPIPARAGLSSPTRPANPATPPAPIQPAGAAPPAFVAHQPGATTPPPLPAKVTRDRLHATGDAPADSPRPAASAAPPASPRSGADPDSDLDVDMEDAKASAAAPPAPDVAAAVAAAPPASSAQPEEAAAPTPEPAAAGTPPPVSHVISPTGPWLAEHVNRPARRRRLALLAGAAALIGLVVGTAALRTSKRPGNAGPPVGAPGQGSPATPQPAPGTGITAPLEATSPAERPRAQAAETATAPHDRADLAAAPAAKPPAPGLRYRVTQLAAPATPAPAPAAPEPAPGPTRSRELPVLGKTAPPSSQARAIASAPGVHPRSMSNPRPRVHAAPASFSPSGKAGADPGARSVPAASVSPAAAAAAYKRGNERLLAGDAAAALAAFGEAIASDSHLAVAHRGLGLAHAQLGHRAAALRSLRTYLRLAPTAPDRDLIQSRLHLLAP